MNRARLEKIAYHFPLAEPDSRTFFATLCDVLRDATASDVTADSIFFVPRDPPNALPITTFTLSHVPCPLIRFDEASAAISFVRPNEGIYRGTGEARTERDALGSYVRLENGEMTDFTALLPIEELYQRLRGHVTRLDHTGVNLPAGETNRDAWDMLTKNVAATANLYRYPTGEPWPFLLPATDAEFATDIQHFTTGRGPKFELVYDPSLRYPLIQIDIHTDLPRAEIERRFPEPYGRAIPGLEAFFRSVYLLHPWPGLSFRIDLRYRDDGPPSDWDTGAWLVTAGGRIR